MEHKEIEQVEDLFLKALIKNDGLKVPSKNFTASIMAKLPSPKVVAEESTRFLGRNLTLIIFGIVAVINIIIIYFLWPYFSVWIPENSVIGMVLDNLSALVSGYATRIFHQSITISLLLIIGLGIFVLIGKDSFQHAFQKLSGRFSI